MEQVAPVKIIGDNGDEMEISNILSGSNFGPIGAEGNFVSFTAQNMGDVLYRRFTDLVQEMSSKDNREVTVEQLRAIRKHMDALSRVFGFDDPNQLEAFFAAWLMKDSTCRLNRYSRNRKNNCNQFCGNPLSQLLWIQCRPPIFGSKACYARARTRIPTLPCGTIL